MQPPSQERSWEPGQSGDVAPAPAPVTHRWKTALWRCSLTYGAPWPQAVLGRRPGRAPVCDLSICFHRISCFSLQPTLYALLSSDRLLLSPPLFSHSSPVPIASVRPRLFFQPPTMGFVEDELKRLNDVVDGLSSRVKQLEHRSTGSSSTAEEVRMILIGPPGAGSSLPAHLFLFRLHLMLTCSQAREPRPPRSRSAFRAATWYVKSLAQRSTYC